MRTDRTDPRLSTIGSLRDEDIPALETRPAGAAPQLSGLVRTGGPGDPVYIYPEAPFWFVPDSLGDGLLQRLTKGGSREDLAGMLAAETGVSLAAASVELDDFLRSVAPPPFRPHPDRAGLPLGSLSELWLHVTDTCNLRCRHCLFETTRGSGRHMELDEIHALVREACGLGCRLVCFTGGEPFTVPGFPALLNRLQQAPDLRVAVLTNGTRVMTEIGSLKKLDPDRIHLQVSLDGPETVNDALRGKGAFRSATSALKILCRERIPCSIAMAVNAENVREMESVIRIAQDLGVSTVHYLWHFVRGMGDGMERAGVDPLLDEFRKAAEQARTLGVNIDNLEALRAQVFSPAGTRFDLGNAGWESLAVGPDLAVYPTPAMVDIPAFQVGSARHGLEQVWRESEPLQRFRSLSLTRVPQMNRDPWRYVIGGGDLDHCCVHRDGQKDLRFLRGDPYAPLYREMVRMLIAEEAKALPVPRSPGIVLRMGEITTDCPSGREVNFTHSNCLLSVGEGTTKGLVRQFYDDRAVRPDESIRNPVCYDEDRISHVPQEARVRLYGCGSPVLDAGLQPGETVVDLGSGTGVECFIAAREVGPGGRAVGVDMSDPMLDIAERSRGPVRDALGYENTLFLKGYLEALPLAEGVADVVISNCVVNLAHNKRRVFSEILRVLKPGGRLVISDVVAESDPGVSVRGDHRLIGECIGGAMVQEALFRMLRDLGFVDAAMLKRFPYRTVQGHPFHSLTFTAFRPGQQPEGGTETDVVYAGPFQAVVTEEGEILHKGVRTRIRSRARRDPAALAAAGLLILDPASGAVTNREAVSACACYSAPSSDKRKEAVSVPRTGCRVCGAPLVYLETPEERTCARCGNPRAADAVCTGGHFVCDACHIQGPVEWIRQICLATRETDMLRLFQEIRSRPGFPVHGPEHHGLVPGVILATYRNLGGAVTDADILAGIERGSGVPGGACAFLGSCGAALGVGIAFSILLGATPLTPGRRQAVQAMTAEVVRKLSLWKAARCCRRDGTLAIREAAALSETWLPVKLRAEADFPCDQSPVNQECIRKACPLYPGDASLGTR